MEDNHYKQFHCLYLMVVVVISVEAVAVIVLSVEDYTNEEDCFSSAELVVKILLLGTFGAPPSTYDN